VDKKVRVIIVIGLDCGDRLKDRVGNRGGGGGEGTLQERTESGVSLQNFLAQKEGKMSSGFKHDLVSLTLLIIIGFHEKKSFF
jgi:hypothetical protein